jgi:Glycosyl hydrolase 36 superfamily, catalytic domain/Phosphoglucomutase/phosphomannomutase, alpha/beta/alpha domain II/Phosphoglucomutase/phosphomannomutase, alpha/beta/alpha domain I
LTFTASHNPPEWNGLKVFRGDGSPLLDDETRQIEKEANSLTQHDVIKLELDLALAAGIVERRDFTNEYVDAVEALIDLEEIREVGLKVIVDPMYGVGQLTLGTVLTEARCRVTFIHERHNPLFGGRSPAPNEEALRLLSSEMQEGSAVDKYLYSEYGIHLLWPAFSKPNDDIGFVGRVYKGIKENAAIFSHPNPWAVIAECKLERGERAMKFYNSLLPYNQNDKIEVREAEPYSYCQFVMGKDHTADGRARHPWLTGSGGWNYTAVTRWILGVRLTFDGLVIDPCVPADWKTFEVTRQWRVATYHIVVENPDGVEKGVKSITLNGKPVTTPIAVQASGSMNEVVVTMGASLLSATESSERSA